MFRGRIRQRLLIKLSVGLIQKFGRGSLWITDD